LKPSNGFGIYDFLNDVFHRTVQEIDSAERTFQECDPHKSYMSEEQQEIIRSHFSSLKRALETIQKNPNT